MAVRAAGRVRKGWLQAEAVSPPILHETVGVTPPITPTVGVLDPGPQFFLLVK